jgi:nucleotidyltransferase substrate binding protein (TIGR01987 family)
MTLDLSSFEKALNSLARAITRSQEAPGDDELRDSVIQGFEYTYDLSWKMLKRRLEMDSPSPETIDALSFRDLIREGAVNGLIADPEAWFEYREQRNITSHTYDEKKAAQVYRAALKFYPDAKALFDGLLKRNPGP